MICSHIYVKLNRQIMKWYVVFLFQSALKI